MSFRSFFLNFGLSLFCISSVFQISAFSQPTKPPATKPGPASPVSPANSLSPDTKSIPTIPAPAAHPLEKADLEAFLDGIIPMQLERSDIAGASVLVMKDGEVLLKKGYGYADEKSHKPVDPDSTIFRLASISKLFTWVSVMQLEEQGKLDIDTDINKYLDFEIKPAFNKPITLRNLMTHTGGFEDTANDIIYTDVKRNLSLRDFLIRNQPKRIFPPGQIPSYSNYGVGLASYIVQRISGERYEQYVQEHIFAPLAMTHSTFYQPPPKELAGLPSEGYRGDTTKPAVGFEIFNPVGAGGLSSTALDMGRFGQALLNGGELDGKRILKQQTLAEMWTPQFRASDKLPAQCMGFYQVWRNSLRWIGHEGDLIAFHSLFFMEPTQKLVFFVSYNSAGGGGKPRSEMIDFFSDRYFPGVAKPVFVKTPVNELKQIDGVYQATRRTESTKLALANLFGQSTAKVNKDGVLEIEQAKDLRGHVEKWKPIGKDLWYEEQGQRTIFAIRNEKSKIVRVAVDFPGVQMQRVVWFENAKLVLPALAASLLALSLVVLASIIRTGRALFFRGRPSIKPQPGTVWLSWGPRFSAFVWLALLASLGGFFLIAGDDILPPTPLWFPWLMLVNMVTALAMLLSFFAVLSGIRVWFRDGLRWITRVKFSVIALACLILSWFAVHWHVIGSANRM